MTAECSLCTVIIKELCSNISEGHVSFSNPSEARNAQLALNGTNVFGRKVSVLIVDKEKNGSNLTSLYFSFEALVLGATNNEAIIEVIFSQFGDVAEVDVKKRFFDSVTGIQTGYGYVRYTGQNVSVDSTTHVVSDGIKYMIAPCKSTTCLRSQAPPAGRSEARPEANVNAYNSHPAGVHQPQQWHFPGARPIVPHNAQSQQHPNMYLHQHVFRPHPHAHFKQQNQPTVAGTMGAGSHQWGSPRPGVMGAAGRDLERQALMDGERQKLAQYEREVLMQAEFKRQGQLRNHKVTAVGLAQASSAGSGVGAAGGGPRGIVSQPFVQTVQFVPSVHVIAPRAPQPLRCGPGPCGAMGNLIIQNTPQSEQVYSSEASSLANCSNDGWFESACILAGSNDSCCPVELTGLAALSAQTTCSSQTEEASVLQQSDMLDHADTQDSSCTTYYSNAPS